MSRWSPDSPSLYVLVTTLYVDDVAVDVKSVRTAFRQASFSADGFYLNGERLLLFGLNRHQLFPYVGMAMPDRVQRRDAEIFKYELNCNMVRCSHYPQSQAFLDACDELGILVWEEVPGWSYIGDAAWQDLWFSDVKTMVQLDLNHPSVVIWGVQPNETSPAVAAAEEARRIAFLADPTRPTGGTSLIYDWPDYVQDVYAYDDYNTKVGPGGARQADLRAPIAGKPYLVTESVGALEGPHYFRRVLSQEIQQAQALFHAEAHDQAQDPAQTYAGLLAWAGVDYASLNGYAYRGLKTPGVMDTFRIPKPGAAFYQSQVDPSTRAVISPAFYWSFAAASPVTSLGAQALIFSNCAELKVYVGGSLYATLMPGSDLFGNLSWPPFILDTGSVDAASSPDLRIDGYVAGQLVISRSFAGDSTGDHLVVTADDQALVADGSDATRVSFISADRFGNPHPYVGGKVTLSLDGPGSIAGDNPFDFADAGGAGALWLRGLPGQTGLCVVTVSHPTLGTASTVVEMVSGAANS
jgi:beta-galactosidase